MPKRRPSLLLYCSLPGTEVPPVAGEPDPATLPRYVDNATALAIVNKHFTPVSSLDNWPELVWWLLGRQKYTSTTSLIAVAKAKLDAALAVSGLPADRPRHPHEAPPRERHTKRGSGTPPRPARDSADRSAA